MRKALFLLTALLASSCEQAAREDNGPNSQPLLLAAAQSASLEFPLQFGPDDAPPGYIKVDSAEDRDSSHEQLISALVLCSPDVAWVEKTSHSMAIIMPSDKNTARRSATEPQPRDEDVIECIKQSAGQPFFYRELPRGIETYSQP